MTSGYITQGKIVRAVSVHGTYEVLANTGKRFVGAIGLSESSSGLFGVHTSNTYLPGSRVILYVPNKAETGTGISFILGAASDTAIVKDSPYKTLSILDNMMSFLIKRADTDLKFMPEDTILENSYSNGRAADILPGEWAKTTYTGGGFFLSDFMASIGSGERARIETFLFDKLIRISADKLQERVAANDNVAFLEGILNSTVTRESATLLESLGSTDATTPITTTEQDAKHHYDFKYKKEQPYYNHQIVSGDLAQGILETYSLPPKDVDKDRAPGALSIHKGYDGSFGIKALKEISLEKTSIIVAPGLIDEPDKFIEKKSEYDSKPFFEEADATPEDISFFGSNAADIVNKYDLEKDSFEKMRIRDKVWDIPKDQDEVLSDLKKVGVDFKNEPELKELKPTDPYYSEPPKSATIQPFVDEKGKRTGKEVDVFDVSSIIRQGADGSIIIGGGFGEEIRLFRGNIYLTCPGDIITTPGRDSVLVAGGNNIQKAVKGTTEIESKSTTLISEGNMQLVAAASGTTGTMILENKSKLPISMEKYEANMKDNKAVGGGILIKSKQLINLSDDIQVLGTNNNLSNLTVKMGSLNLLTKQAITYIQGGGFSVIGKKSALFLNDSEVGIVSNSIGFNSPVVRCHSSKIDKITYRDMEDKETHNNSMGTGGSSNLIVQNNVTSNSIRTGSASSIAGQISPDPKFYTAFNKIFKSPPPGVNLPNIKMRPSLGILAKELKMWGIVLPESRYTKLELPESKWQTMIKSPLSKWDQLEIEKSFTSGSEKVVSYPGKSNFEATGSLKKLKKDGTIDKASLKDLVINSK